MNIASRDRSGTRGERSVSAHAHRIACQMTRAVRVNAKDPASFARWAAQDATAAIYAKTGSGGAIGGDVNAGQTGGFGRAHATHSAARATQRHDVVPQGPMPVAAASLRTTGAPATGAGPSGGPDVLMAPRIAKMRVLDKAEATASLAASRRVAQAPAGNAKDGSRSRSAVDGLRTASIRGQHVDAMRASSLARTGSHGAATPVARSVAAGGCALTLAGSASQAAAAAPKSRSVSGRRGAESAEPEKSSHDSRSDAFAALAGRNNGWPSDDVAGAAPATPAATGGDVYLDGTLMGRWMSRALTNLAMRPTNSATGFDPVRDPYPVGAMIGG